MRELFQQGLSNPPFKQGGRKGNGAQAHFMAPTVGDDMDALHYSVVFLSSSLLYR